MKRLVLFDIDGTILHGGPLWRECFEAAVLKCFPKVRPPKISFAGKTDRQICREILAYSGCAEGDLDGITREILEHYLELAQSRIADRAREIEVLPGVEQVIEALKGERGVTVGLLTGNLRRGAALKLGAVGLDHHFDFGAYGDDHWDRYELPRIAVDRARSEIGQEFRGKEVVIIGDTIHDVNCGKSIGVRAIAVGTGMTQGHEELLKAGPDFYFEDMSDASGVVEAILREV